MPLFGSVKVPQADIDEMEWSQSKWEMIRSRLIQSNHNVTTDEERSQQVEERRTLAEKLFPLPQGQEAAVTAPTITDLASSF